MAAGCPPTNPKTATISSLALRPRALSVSDLCYGGAPVGNLYRMADETESLASIET